VLLFSKAEQGKKTWRFRPVEPAAAVQAAVRALEYPLSQQGFQLHMTIEDNLPPIAADRDALEQAVLNLLSNAIKSQAMRAISSWVSTARTERSC